MAKFNQVFHRHSEAEDGCVAGRDEYSGLKMFKEKLITKARTSPQEMCDLNVFAYSFWDRIVSKNLCMPNGDLGLHHQTGPFIKGFKFKLSRTSCTQSGRYTQSIARCSHKIFSYCFITRLQLHKLTFIDKSINIL